MPLCAFQDARMRSDDTLVENAFIREFMPAAPERCVKVYLYGLMQCQSGMGESTPQAFARALGMKEEDVYEAFQYWRERGLVNISEHPAYAVLYNSARAALPRDGAVYQYAEFNDTVQNIFKPRVATPAELSRIYDWMDVFSIDEQAIPLLLEYGREKMKSVEQATVGGQIRYIDKIASQWAEEGVRTREQAEEWVQAQQQHSTGITAVMRKMGMHRAPTAGEKKMYQQWLKDGFTPEAVAAATERMTGAYNPSFKYLGEVLGDLLEQGATDEQAVQSGEREAMCREALTALGVRKHTGSSANQMKTYTDWLALAGAHEKVLLACEACNTRGTHSLREVTAMLERWQQKGFTSFKQIREYEARCTHILGRIQEMFTSMGLTRKPNTSDIDKYEQWLKKGMTDELMQYASECAFGASSPYIYMQRLLDIWQQEGVRSVGEARKNREQQSKAAPAKQNPALEYEQRTYKDGDLDFLFDEF